LQHLPSLMGCEELPSPFSNLLLHIEHFILQIYEIYPIKTNLLRIERLYFCNGLNPTYVPYTTRWNIPSGPQPPFI